jgi:hypothetical protein
LELTSVLKLAGAVTLACEELNSKVNEAPHKVVNELTKLLKSNPGSLVNDVNCTVYVTAVESVPTVTSGSLMITFRIDDVPLNVGEDF